jgi:hypothetical protein
MRQSIAPCTVGETIDVDGHRRFCEIEGWSIRTGGKHVVAALTLPDGRTLRTVLGHGDKGDYGDDLRVRVLQQLEVDQSTFEAVLKTRTPPVRPAAVEPTSSKTRALTAYDAELLRYGCVTADEVQEFSDEESEHVAYQLWAAAPIVGCTERRLRIREIIDDFRAASG